MIIARSPLRVTFGGGGTDLPSYYREHGGMVLSAAIDRHVYVLVNRGLRAGTVVRHDEIEAAASPAEVGHPMVREALGLLDVRDHSLEITVMSDVPAGTGLGSSGSLCTALLKALHRLQSRTVDAATLAELASHLEIDRLGQPVGKQDPYAAAFGGLNCYVFERDDRVRVTPLALAPDTLRRLHEGLLLFYTGRTRSASAILHDQDDETRAGSRRMLDLLHEVKAVAEQSRSALERGDLEAFGALLHRHWQCKRQRSPRVSAPDIDRWYGLGLDNGALGGNLVGAGGGGFLMFYAADAPRLRAALAREGLVELSFGFDFEGATLRA